MFVKEMVNIWDPVMSELYVDKNGFSYLCNVSCNVQSISVVEVIVWELESSTIW